MAKSSSPSSSTAKDAQALIQSLRSAYAATPTNLKIIDLYVLFAVLTALIQVVYVAIVGSFPFNSFLSGVLSCTGTAVLAVCLRIQVNKENKEFKDLPQERAFADFVLCNLVLHLVVYVAIVGSFPFNSFLSGVLSCIGTAVLAGRTKFFAVQICEFVCLRIQVNKENRELKDLPQERAFADFVLCNLVLHLVIMNFLG